MRRKRASGKKAKRLVINASGLTLTQLVHKAVDPLARGVDVAIVNAELADLGNVVPGNRRFQFGVKIRGLARPPLLPKYGVPPEIVIKDAIQRRERFLKTGIIKLGPRRPSGDFGKLSVFRDEDQRVTIIVDRPPRVRNYREIGEDVAEKKNLKTQVREAIDGSIAEFARDVFGPRIDSLESGIRDDMRSSEAGIRTDMKSMETGIRTDMKSMETGIRGDMQAMDARLSGQMVSLDSKLDIILSRLDFTPSK